MKKKKTASFFRRLNRGKRPSNQRFAVSLLVIACVVLMCFIMTACQSPEPALPPLTGTVSINGVAEVGQTLTANTNSLGGSGTISYQWKRGTTNIGANNSTYTVQSADVGSTITVIVTRAGYNGSVTSYPVGPVVLPSGPVDPLPPLTGTVSIDGTAEVGQTLTANTDSLGGSGTISYQWKRGTTVIGANSSTYTVQAADEGSTITVTVTRAGNSGSVTSPAIGPIISPAIEPTPTPITVTFSSVTANGSSSQPTTQLTLTFSQAISGLTANDITLSGVSGVQKGTLSGSGPTYILPISGFTSSRTLNVAVTKSGYNISGSSKTVGIYYYTPPTIGIVIDLAGINEWELIEQIVQTTHNEYKYFTVTETYETYHWYLDGVPVGTSSSYYFDKPAGVYQLAVVVTNSSGESRSGRCRITVSN